MKLWPVTVRARLTLWYTAFLGTMLIVFAAASLVVLERILASRSDRFLEEMRDILVSELITEGAEGPTAEAAIRTTLDEMRLHHVRVAVFDSAFRLVDTSAALRSRARLPGENAEPPVDLVRLASELRSGALASDAMLTLADEEGGSRVLARTLIVRGQPYTVALIQGLHGHRETMEMVGSTYLVAIPLFLLLAAIGGSFLARRNLAPVAAMRRRAAEISATNLHSRLPVENARDELGELALMINGLLARLEESFEQQRRFMADASHELRTPVAIMRAEADVVLSRPRREEVEYRDSITVMREAVGRLSRIVEDLFLLARVDAGHQPLRREPLYLDELVANAARAVRAIAERRAIGIEVLASADMPYTGDAALLSRLLLNLLDNALKYSPDGGSVIVSSAVAGGEYRITVADSGPGIPADAQPHVFDRFFRVDRSRSPAEQSLTSGAGLGLAISRWIAEAHGGRLELVRSTATGTEIRIVLPAEGEQSEVESPVVDVASSV